jgi:hypothetical protein
VITLIDFLKDHQAAWACHAVHLFLNLGPRRAPRPKAFGGVRFQTADLTFESLGCRAI